MKTFFKLVLPGIVLFFCSTPAYSQEKDRGAQLYEDVSKAEIPWKHWATSRQGRDIYLLELGSGDSTTIIFGGFHGNEFGGAKFVFEVSKYLYANRDSLTCRVLIVPLVNPDGLVANTRTNAGAVDINRNFPAKNWQPTAHSKGNFPGPSPGSEPETRAVIKLLETWKADRIITVHTPLSVVNYDGPGKQLAEAMSAHNGYSAEADIGYPTPGSFGTWAGIERQIPTITLELPRSSVPFDTYWEANLAAVLQALQY